MADVSLFAFGCAVSFLALGGARLYLIEILPDRYNEKEEETGNPEKLRRIA